MSWADEVRKEYKEGRNAQNGRRENSWVESVRAEYRPHNAALDAQKSSWFKEASDFIQQSSAGLQERSKAYQDAGTFEKYRQDTASRAKKLLQDSDPVRELATRIVDEKQRKQYLDTVAGMQQYLSAVPKDLDSLKEYWSQWGSQADYESWKREAEAEEKRGFRGAGASRSFAEPEGGVANNAKALGTDALSGLSNFSDSVWKAIDWLIPEEMFFNGDNAVGRFFDSMYKANTDWNALEDETDKKANQTVQGIGDNIVQPVFNTLPSTAVAMMTGGLSAAPSLAGASSGLGSAVTTSLQSMAKNPSFWMSAIPMFGSTYDSALQEGASELEATATAFLNAFAGSVIEIGGGIETIPNSSGKIRDWVKGLLDEGKEEVLQGIVENLAKKALYDQAREWASFDNPNAVFNPSRAAQEFAGGAIVGGILGGAEIGIGKAATAVSQRKIGNHIIQNNQVRDAIRMGFESDVDSPAYRAAVELSEQLVNGEKLSPARVGAMVADAQQQAVSRQGVYLRQVAQEAVNGGNALQVDTDIPQVKNTEFAASNASVRTLKDIGADTAQAQVNSRLADRTSVEQNLQGNRDASIGTKAAAMLVSDIENAVPVRVEGIDSVSENGMTVTLENGETAAITDVQFENPQVESLYYAAANYETNTARAFVSGYNGSVPLKTYKTAFDFLHNQAMRGVPFETAVQQFRQSAGLVSQMVGTQAQYMAYHSGVNEAAALKNGGKSEKLVLEKSKSSDRDVSEPNSTVEGAKHFKKGVTKEYQSKDLTKAQRKQISILDAYGKAHGLSFVMVDTIEDGKANGYYKDGVIRIALDAQEQGYLVTAGHEVFHYLEEKAPEQTAKLREYVCGELKNSMGADAYEALVQERMAQYNTTDRLLAESEIAANGLFDVFRSESAVQRLAKTNRALALKVRTALTNFLHELNKIVVKLSANREEIAALRGNAEVLQEIAERFDEALNAAQGTKKAAQKNGERYALNPNFAAEYDAWDKRSAGGRFKIGTTSEALQSIGIDPSRIYWDKSKIIQIKKKHSGMTDEAIKNVPAILENPIVVMQSQTVANRVVLFGELVDASGNPVLAALELHPKNNRCEIGDFVKVASAYGKEGTSSIQRLLDTSEILFIDPDKNRTDSWLQARRLQLPVGVASRYGSIGKVTYSHKNVNGEIVVESEAPTKSAIQIAFEQAEKNSANTSISETSVKDTGKYSLKDSNGKELSEEQQDFFSESKIRDKDGRLQVMYRGGNDEFTVFDRRKASYSNLYGKGFYFTDSKAHAAQYGEAKSFYLNITNPVSVSETTITRSQLRKFLREVQRNEDDYSFENYGYDATLDSVLRSIYGKSDFAMLYDVSQTAIGDMVETVELFNRVNGTDFDGLKLDTETVAFRSEQIKNTDNIRPTNNPDIRFSLKDVTEVDVKALTQENSALQEQVNLLKQEFRLTNGHIPSKKALDKLAGKILSQTHSKYSRETLTRNLEVVFRYIANDPEANFTEAMDALVDVSNSVLQQSSVMNRKLYDEYADMREYFHKTRLSLSDSVKAALTDGYASFRARNFGRMNLVNDGMALDEAWAEISGMWPEFFSADTNAADQPIAVAEALRSVEPTYENPYGMNNADAAHDLALQVYEEYFGIPEVHTFADKQNAKLEQLRAKYSSRLEKVRREAKERNELQKELFREKMEAQASKRKESAAVRKYKPRIIRDAMELGRWLNRPTEQKHVPEPLRETVAEFLNSIDFSSSRTNRYGEPAMRTMAWANLRDQLTKVQNGEFSDDVRAMLDTADPDLIPNLADLVENAKTFRLDEMTGEQLRELSKTVAALKSMIVNANKMLTSAQSETADVIASGVHNDLLSRKNAKELTGVPGMAQKMLQFDMLDAPSYFEELGTTAYGKLYKPLRQGFDVKIQDTRTAIEYMQETLNGIDTKEWSGEKSAMHVFHVSGGSITLTTAQVMSLYELSKRKQAMGHILGGGIKAAPIQRGWFNGKRLGLPHMESSTRPITLSADDVQAIVRSLTAEQRKVADRIADFFKTTSRWGNEVSSQMYGYSKFTEENYFPIVSDKDYLTTMQGDLKKPDAILKNLGITKSTAAGANNPIVIEDIFDVFTRQVDQMSSYHAFVVPLADLQKVLNFKVSGEGGKVQGSTKETLNRVFGRAGISYLNKLVEDINGMSRGLPPTLGDKLLSNMKAAAVGVNLRVVIQQPTAYVRAAAMVDPKYLAKGLAMKSDLETMNRYAPISYWKDIGFFEMDTSRGMRDILLGKERLRDLTMKPAGWADKITWGKLWNAVTAEIADTRSELKEGTEAFYKACGSRFSDIVDRTQVVDSVLHRSQLMRSKNFIDKTVTSFMSEPTKSYNLLRSAMRDVQNGGGAAARKRLARASMAFVVTSIATAAAAALVDSFRDDDRDKKWWNKFLDAFGSNTIDNMNPINMIPYLKDLGSLVSGYSLTRQEMAGFTDVSYSVRKWMKYFEGASEYSAAYLVKDSAASLSKLLGLPISSILREVEAVTNGSLGLLEEAGVPIARIRYTLDTMIYPVNEKNASRYADYLYDAIAEGDAKFADKIRGSLSAAGKSDDAISTMIRQRLVKNDTDVAKAAIARLGGNLDEYERLVYQIRDKGFGQDLAVGAVNNYMTALETAAGYRRDGKEGKYNDKISSIISPGMDEETADKVRALTIELSGKPQAENEEEDDKEPTSLYKASDVGNALMEKGLDDALSTADAIIKEVKEQTSSLPLKEQEKKLDAKISAIKSGVTSQYKKLYIAAFKRKDFKETQSIMRLLIQIRVNGKRLFTQDDFKSWNKDAQKKE